MLVSESPMQYITKKDYFPEILIDLGDKGPFSEPANDIYPTGRITLGGIEYEYKTRAFTRYYYVVTLSKD